MHGQQVVRQNFVALPGNYIYAVGQSNKSRWVLHFITHFFTLLVFSLCIFHLQLLVYRTKICSILPSFHFTTPREQLIIATARLTLILPAKAHTLVLSLALQAILQYSLGFIPFHSVILSLHYCSVHPLHSNLLLALLCLLKTACLSYYLYHPTKAPLQTNRYAKQLASRRCVYSTSCYLQPPSQEALAGQIHSFQSFLCPLLARKYTRRGSFNFIL